MSRKEVIRDRPRLKRKIEEKPEKTEIPEKPIEIPTVITYTPEPEKTQVEPKKEEKTEPSRKKRTIKEIKADLKKIAELTQVD
jgi:hypothetical protein